MKNQGRNCPTCEEKLTELDEPNNFICNNCEGLFKWDEEKDCLVRI